MNTEPIWKSWFARHGAKLLLFARQQSRRPDEAEELVIRADQLAGEDFSVEVIDMRTTSPLDRDTVLESVRKTGRLVVVDEANPICSLASEISSIAAEHAFESLDAPIRKVTAPHTPVPAAPNLEALYLPDTARIVAAARETLEFEL